MSHVILLNRRNNVFNDKERHMQQLKSVSLIKREDKYTVKTDVTQNLAGLPNKLFYVSLI